MNYHQVKMEYRRSVKLCVAGYYIQAKQPLKWVMTHSRKYKSLHLDSGLALAGIYKKLSEFEYAIRLHEYLIDTFAGASIVQAILHLDLAIARHQKGDHTQAKNYACMAKNYQSEGISSSQMWYLLMLEGRYYGLCGIPKAAIVCHEKAWSICEEAQITYRMMQVASNIGHHLVDSGDDDEGGKLVGKGLNMACRIGAQYWAAKNCQSLMQLAFRRGDLLEAKEYGKHCFMLAYRNGYRSVVEGACQSTGDYYHAIGDNEVADVFYHKAINVGSESPGQVLEKVDRIYDTAYSERRLNVKFNSSSHKLVLDESTDSISSSMPASKTLKYRYIIGSVKSKSGKPHAGGGEAVSNQ